MGPQPNRTPERRVRRAVPVRGVVRATARGGGLPRTDAAIRDDFRDRRAPYGAEREG
jgi:hypothetical protein